MINIKRYTQNDKKEWNTFNASAKNSLFMFDRNYMDYHSDRFKDHSLMFYDEKSKLLAVLPMNEKDGVFYSHGGLTYGGFITGFGMKQHLMNECMNSLIEYCRINSIRKIIYKTIPHIYCTQSAEEDRFALFLHSAKLITVDVSTYVNLSDPIKIVKGRKAQISKAKREMVYVKLCNTDREYYRFIELENEVLLNRHGTKAVHSGNELYMLHESFPSNIHLFGAFHKNEMIGGVVLYEYADVIHTQYMAANDDARMLGALDLTIDYIMEKYRIDKKWLDFGISTEHGRIYLNEGLVAQKEGFGGRTGIYEIWEINIDQA